MRTVQKPWGEELIFAETARYAGKLLHIEPGASLSLQLHTKKHETLFALVGRPSFFRNGVWLSADEPVCIWPGSVHRIVNATEEPVVVVEVSTPELDDVVRLADEYGRVDA